jgi:hypothetical protein
MPSLVLLVVSLMVSHSARAAPPFTPKNGCRISSNTPYTSPRGLQFRGTMVESYDDEGLKLLAKKTALDIESNGLKSKAKKTEADLKKIRDLEVSIAKITKDAESHLIKAFWPKDEFARDRGSNEKFPASCPKKVMEDGVAVLNPASKLREPCVRIGLDLPSAPEVEALWNCFRMQITTGRMIIEVEELKKIIPPVGDLYFATKEVNQKESSEYTELIKAFSSKYMTGEMNEQMDSSSFLAIQCMGRIKK